MAYIKTSAIVAILASSLVSAAVIGSPLANDKPTLVQRAQTCTATLTGSWTEGGAGPGQSPISFNKFGINTSKTGVADYASEFCNASGMDITCPTISASQYGGTFDTTCSGVYNYEDNSFISCTCNNVGGAVQSPTIQSGTVSVTVDNCIVVYDC